MTTVVTRGLKEDKDRIAGYIAHPERGEKRPALSVDSPALRSHRIPQERRL